MTKVMIADCTDSQAAEVLRRAGYEVEIASGSLDSSGCPGFSGLIVRSGTQVTEEFLAASPELAVVARAGVGVDNIDIGAASKRGVLVANAPSGNTVAAAEHTVALMFALARNIVQAADTTRHRQWERQRFMGVELAGKTLGIIGYGRIGSTVADRALALGMDVAVYDPYAAPRQAVPGQIRFVDLDELLEQADFVSLHLPLTAETCGLISAQALAKMKPGVRIINAARGALIDEQALAEALRSGHVAGAALDVLAEEPCLDSPLLEFDNVIITPHLGACTLEAQVHVAVEAAEQVIAALSGERPEHCLNWERTGPAKPPEIAIQA